MIRERRGEVREPGLDIDDAGPERSIEGFLVFGLKASLGQRPSDVVGLPEATIGGGETTRHLVVECSEDLPQLGLAGSAPQSLFQCVRSDRVKTGGFEVDRQLVQATLDLIERAFDLIQRLQRRKFRASPPLGDGSVVERWLAEERADLPADGKGRAGRGDGHRAWARISLPGARIMGHHVPLARP